MTPCTQKHKGSAPFRNKGWPWYNKILPLMPSSPRGSNVYCASSGSQHPPADDEEQPEPPGTEPNEGKPFSDWVSDLLLLRFIMLIKDTRNLHLHPSNVALMKLHPDQKPKLHLRLIYDRLALTRFRQKPPLSESKNASLLLLFL